MATELTPEWLRDHADGEELCDYFEDGTVGTVYFSHASDWEMGDDGRTRDWVNVKIIGAVVLTDTDGMDIEPVAIDASATCDKLSDDSYEFILDAHANRINGG